MRRGGQRTQSISSDSDSDFDDSESEDNFDQKDDDPTLSSLSNPDKTLGANDIPSDDQVSDNESISQSENSYNMNRGGDDQSDGSVSAGSQDLHSRKRTSGFGKSQKSANTETVRGSEMAESDDESHTNSPGSRKEKDQLKADLLSKFDRLKKKGLHVSKNFTMKSKLSDMQKEFERLNRNIEVDGAIKFQRKALVAILSGVEFLNKKFDPFSVKLEGWTESITNDIGEYDNIFEKLYDKYHGTAEMAPEIELMMMIAGSALMFHMSKSLFNNSNFNINDILKNNPDLMKNLMSQMQGGGGGGSGYEKASQWGPVGGIPNQPTDGGGSQRTRDNQFMSNQGKPTRAQQSIIDDISERLSEESFDSNDTGVKSISFKTEPTNKSDQHKMNGKKHKNVLDLVL